MIDPPDGINSAVSVDRSSPNRERKRAVPASTNERCRRMAQQTNSQSRSGAAAKQKDEEQNRNRYPEQPKQDVPGRSGFFNFLF
jgi:hypothetical protein